jgi:hypothetical protein
VPHPSLFSSEGWEAEKPTLLRKSQSKKKAQEELSVSLECELLAIPPLAQKQKRAKDGAPTWLLIIDTGSLLC